MLYDEKFILFPLEVDFIMKFEHFSERKVKRLKKINNKNYYNDNYTIINKTVRRSRRDAFFCRCHFDKKKAGNQMESNKISTLTVKVQEGKIVKVMHRPTVFVGITSNQIRGPLIVMSVMGKQEYICIF